MESLRELYRIGPGPSSSHSLGVRNACIYYHDRHPGHDAYLVELYGSLALTGRGHMTDKVIYDYFGKDHVTVRFCHEPVAQPNTMKLYCLQDGKAVDPMTIYSIGGGAIAVEGEPPLADENVYPEANLKAVLDLCQRENWTLAQYVQQREPDIRPYLKTVKDHMLEVVAHGLTQEGFLPGPLHLEKVAKRIKQQADENQDPVSKQRLLVTAYAYAALEESSSGAIVVTAPTLGASGVVSSLVRYYRDLGTDEETLLDGLAAAGVIGNVVKTNATISGAQGGCQAEIGTACAMGAGFAACVERLPNRQIEYAAEVAMEHNLGLTCDPVGGYVQIPCIERNGVAALRSLDAKDYAKYIGRIKANRVSFDMVVEVMNYTGRQIPRELRETSLGGLAMELKLDEQNPEV
jgi:L-serine dehydratase